MDIMVESCKIFGVNCRVNIQGNYEFGERKLRWNICRRFGMFVTKLLSIMSGAEITKITGKQEGKPCSEDYRNLVSSSGTVTVVKSMRWHEGAGQVICVGEITRAVSRNFENASTDGGTTWKYISREYGWTAWTRFGFLRTGSSAGCTPVKTVLVSAFQ